MRNRRIQYPAEILSLMTVPSCERLEARAGFCKQFLSHCQIALCSRKAGMTEIGCQLGQKIVQISVTAIPCGDAVNCCRMPEIMHPRLVAGATVPPNAGDRAQATKCDSERSVTQSRAV